MVSSHVVINLPIDIPSDNRSHAVLQELWPSAHHVVYSPVDAVGVVPLGQSNHKHISHGLTGRYVDVIVGAGETSGPNGVTVNFRSSLQKWSISVCVLTCKHRGE